jgi:pyruvate dehydrogenase E1 component beta subunit
MAEMSFGEAKIAAVAAAMRADERVVIIGGAGFGGHRHPTMAAPLFREFPDRIYRTPISEMAYVGLGIGAAITGMRPIVTVSTSSFLFQGWAQIINEAPNIYQMTAGQTRVPMLVHILTGLRIAGAAQHSARPQAMLMQAPGLQIIAPATVSDVMGMIQPVLDSERPTVWADHVLLVETGLKEEAPPDGYTVPLGKVDIKRPGRDVTLVAYGITLARGLKAAEQAAKEGIDVEVVDLRTLAPLDREGVLQSAARTRRLVIADECSLTCGVAAEIAASVAEQGVSLAKPLKRVTVPDVPVPLSPVLEDAITPTEERILDGIKAVM